MTSSQRNRRDRAFGPPIDSEQARVAIADITAGCDRLYTLFAMVVPPGPNLNKALQLIESAYLQGKQGIETTPPAA